ncbi:type II toxin-antitoxin system VapC family toxin [Deinococcus wulumuqiensis]|uniref:PIN domain-containing protein n=1 Tax=Deinococcus wulumuqiensis TaxID=980427 RepID=A0AAV4K492_9DEIO|nr:hypothetical protein [Deinococcus wulumuqiensis]QII20977.1 type II toxin-antitoxin system VapC family toxin [Deinococcus wulumuqiensis R12]GGI79654.1 hypothetical protein GCM10010914_12240 [Deinococcus wulumuqiensis]GGP28979.1 hypothetical protein GCM10008021_06300 [Deinococcus wulumuqiensis]
MTPDSTALDANILSALLRSEANALPISRRLAALACEGSLIVSPVVHAELLAGPGVTPDFVIGAHALRRGDALFTADPQHDRLGFPFLPVLTP